MLDNGFIEREQFGDLRDLIVRPYSQRDTVVLAPGDTLTTAWGPQARWVLDQDVHPHEAHRLMLDSAKAQARLGWRPVWALQEALARIVTWHKAHNTGADMRQHCFAEIAAYCRDAAKAA